MHEGSTRPSTDRRDLRRGGVTKEGEIFFGAKGNALLFYQIKIVINQYKTDEFVENIHPLSRGFRKEKGCLGYSVYQDSEKEHAFSVIGEWSTRQAMEKHFQTHNFEVLIGAARVLGDTFEIKIAEVMESKAL